MAAPLSRDEEVALAHRIKAGDKAAEDELVTRNLPLVGKLAKQFVDQGLDLCDLIQEGSIGLIHAARSFEAERETRFSTWAGRLVHQHMTKAVERVRRRPRQLSDREAAMIAARPGQGGGAEEDRSVRLRVAFEVLDDSERAVLDMKFGGATEQSLAGISLATGRSRSAVGRTKRKAVAKLKRSLNPEPKAALARTG